MPQQEQQLAQSIHPICSVWVQSSQEIIIISTVGATIGSIGPPHLHSVGTIRPRNNSYPRSRNAMGLHELWGMGYTV